MKQLCNYINEKLSISNNSSSLNDKFASFLKNLKEYCKTRFELPYSKGKHCGVGTKLYFDEEPIYVDNNVKHFISFITCCKDLDTIILECKRTEGQQTLTKFECENIDDLANYLTNDNIDEILKMIKFFKTKYFKRKHENN